MKDNFAPCLAFTLHYEGGKVDDPRDPGGKTNQGITQRTYAAWLAARGRPAATVYDLAPADRDAIYRGSYWDAVKADGLPPGADLAVFDYAVNSGPARALKAYAARTSNDPAAITRAVCAARLSFLRGLATFRVFGKGWAARVAACEALGVKMAEHARIGLPVDAPAVPQVRSTLAHAGTAAAVVAARHRKAAAGIGAAGGAGAATTQAPGAEALHLPWPLLAVLLLTVAAVAGVLAWRATVAAARATAYAAEAAAPARA